MYSLESERKSKGIDPVEIFVGAVANEMHRDAYIFRKFLVFQHTKFVPPRLEKMTYLAQTFPKSLALITNIASTLWSPLLYPALLVYQAVRALRYIGGAGGNL